MKCFNLLLLSSANALFENLYGDMNNQNKDIFGITDFSNFNSGDIFKNLG